MTCSVQKASLIVGDKWTLFIMREFLFNENKQGFNQLLRGLKPISSRTLAIKLKKLEENKLLIRKVKDTRPITVEYSVTKKGLKLKQALQSLGEWYETD